MSPGGDHEGDRSPAGASTVTGSVPADLPTGSVVAGRFRIEGVLGIGGMGVVYRAFDEALGIPVAIKLLRSELADRPGAFERFRQELLLARQVSSPHVVRIHDIARHGEGWLISMDLVDGEALDARMDRQGALPVADAVAIARQVALGLAAAHARGIVHRDLKPSNVLLDAEGHALVGDFGIARSLGTHGLTQTGAVVGTPDYLSPEQARAEPVDGRSDLYALGLLLYEMLAGKPAFSDGTRSESLSQRLVGPPPPIRGLRAEVPAWVERLIDRLLRPQPSHRLQTATAVVEAIDHESVPRDWRSVRGVALGVAAVALLGIAGAWLWPRMQTAPAAAPMPDRLLLLPMANQTGDASLDPALSALDDSLLRQRAASTPVADGERLAQALAQLRLPDAGAVAVDSATLRKEARGTVIVRSRVKRGGDGYVVSGIIQAPGEADVGLSASGPDLVAAVRAYDRALAGRRGERVAADPGLWTVSWPALRAHGEGLLLRRAGRMEPATESFRQAATLSPDYVPAWLATSRAALASGQAALATQAATRAQALAGSPRLRAEALGAKALAGAPEPAALGAWQALVEASPDDLDARLALAQLQGGGNQLVQGMEQLRALLARDGGDPRAWFLLGKYSIMHGDLRDAVDEQLVRALVLYKRGRNAFGEAETVNALGVAYSRLGQVDDAIEQFGKAVELRRALGDRRGVASSLRNLAQLATVQGRFEQAKAQLDEARGLFAALGDEGGLEAVDNELGVLAEERGDYRSAEEAFRRVLRGREAASDDFGVASSLNNLGFARFALGDYDAANAFWQQSLAAFSRLDDQDGIVRASQNLGALELARGRWEDARKLLDSSLAVAERQQMVEEAAVSRFYLAELEYAQGRLGTALGLLDRAGSLFSSRGDQRGLVDVALLRARLLFDAGALPAASKALAEAAEGGSAEQRAAASLLRARLAQAKGDKPAARAALAQAREAAEGSGVQAMKLRIAIASDPAADLDAATRALGHLGLRLDWLLGAMRQRLASGDKPGAARLYAQARDELRGHDAALQAPALHALGARALEGSDQAAAVAARERAAAGRTRIAADLPESLREAYLGQVEAVADAH